MKTKFKMKGITNKYFASKLVFTVLIVSSFFLGDVYAQSCVTTSRKSWEWPAHNHWFLPELGKGYVLDQRAGTVNEINEPGDPSTPWIIPKISGYQGVSCASDDNGELLFFTNGIKAWKADGTLITDQIWSGSECGWQVTGTSAAHGNMIIRHPLQPKKYYIISVDDVVNQGVFRGDFGQHSNNCPGTNAISHGISYAVIDSNANLVHSSKQIESDIVGNHQGQIRTTEGFAATFHANGVDIWVTFHPLWSKYVVSYLLTCNGFVTDPVVSGNGIVPYVDIDEGLGNLDFTQDGSTLALGVEIAQTAVQVDSKKGHGTVNIYDFNNETGEISNRKAIYPNQGGSGQIYNVLFGPNDKWLHFSGDVNGKLDISSGDESIIRGTLTSTPIELPQSNVGAGITYDGSIVNTRSVSLANGISSPSLSGNNMYIPPLEEPDIEETGPWCNDLDSVIDLNTKWICSGVDSEEAIRVLDSDHGYFFTKLDITEDVVTGKKDTTYTDISGSMTPAQREFGTFKPKNIGAGALMVEFRFCEVEDTIWITINECSKCEVKIENDTLYQCLGDDPLLLDTLVVEKSIGPNIKTHWKWGVHNLISTGDMAQLDSSGVDTSFVTTINSMAGHYRVVFEVNNKGTTCSDSLIVKVDSLPKLFIANDKICKGDPAVTFTAAPPASGTWDALKWNNDASETGTTFSTADSGEYVLEFTDENGCVEDTVFKLVWDTIPTPDLGPERIICQEDDSVIFNAGPALVWVWNTGATSREIKAHFDPQGTQKTSTYSVTVTDGNGCVNDTFVDLTVNPTPKPFVDNDTICFGSSDVEFDAGSGWQDITWTWGNNTETTQTITLNGQGGDTIRVTLSVEDNNTCKADTIFHLIVDTLPEPSLSNHLICSDSSGVTFNPGTYTSYVWHDGSKGTVFTTKDAGDVVVTVTDSKGCLGTTQATLTVIDLPEPNIEGTTMCPGMTQTIIPALVDNSQAPYTYKWHDNSTDPSYIASSDETISVEVTDKNGCKASDNAVISINSVLTPVIVGSPTITRCIDEPTVKLISNYNTVDGYLFEWTDGTTGDLLSANESINNVSTAGTFDLYVHNGQGCKGNTTVDIVVNPIPVMTAQPANICAGLSTQIGVDIQTGSYSYAWNTVPITSTRILDVNEGGTYTQTVTNTTTGCVNDTVFIVTEFPNPIPDIQEQTECLGVELVLRDLNDKGETATYTWSGGTGAGPSDSSAYLPLSTATYRLDVIDVNGCVGFDEAVVTFLDIPEVTTQDSIVMCEGESKLLEAQVLDPSNTLSWNTGQGDVASFTVSQNQLHIVTASNGYCQTTSSTEVVVLPIPISEIDHTIAEQTYCFEEENFRGVEITAGTNPAYTYLWGPGGEITPSISAMEPGTYSVTITAGQCPIEDGLTLRPYCPSFLYVANAFTPDGDGLNDFFSPKAHNLEDGYRFYIYNRWGELIYQSEDVNQGWDGTYMGNPCQIDVYVWKVYYSVEHPDGNPRKEQKTGRVSLIR